MSLLKDHFWWNYTQSVTVRSPVLRGKGFISWRDFHKGSSTRSLLLHLERMLIGQQLILQQLILQMRQLNEKRPNSQRIYTLIGKKRSAVLAPTGTMDGKVLGNK